MVNFVFIYDNQVSYKRKTPNDPPQSLGVNSHLLHVNQLIVFSVKFLFTIS
jgi:hypothetical protein